MTEKCAFCKRPETVGEYNICDRCKRGYIVRDCPDWTVLKGYLKKLSEAK
jgi:hypothetical protein